jgi:oligopeptidase B
VSYEPGEQKIVFLYSSLRTPPTCYTYGIKSRKLMIRWRRQVPGYNADNYNAEVLPLKRKDGSTIPVALIYRPDLSYTDGSNPLLIIAGSVRGQVTGDAFDPANISLLDRGFGIAVIDPARLMKTGSEYLEEDLAALIKLLTDKKQTNPGGIVVQAAQTNCAAVAGLMKKNPAMFRAVLFDDPIIPGPWEIQNHPPLFITNKWDNGSQNAINNLFSVSGLRRIKGDKNLLICETGFSDETVRNQSIASQWLFLLEECGIKK